MSNLTVRKIPWDFTDVPFIWNPDNPEFSTTIIRFSFAAVAFEKMLCKAFRQVHSLIEDPELQAENRLFIRQEAVHNEGAERHIAELIKRYPGLADTRENAIEYWDRLLVEHGLEYCVCFLAALEGTFTPTGKMIIENRETLFGGGDARVASMWLWHLSEEIEHRSTALKIYNHVYNKPFGRVHFVTAGTVRRFFKGFNALVMDGIAEHVPEEDRAQSTGRHRMGLDRIPRWERWMVALKVFRSVTPWHDPQDQPIPEFGVKLLADFDAGKDLTQYYGRRVQAA